MSIESVQHTREKSIVCSLYNGDYHLGLGALVNSLVYAGFRGDVWVGYQGDLPPWTKELTATAESRFTVSPDVELVFEHVDTQDHLTNVKPRFMRSLVDRGIALGSLWYFDPDIVIDCSWNFFEMWVSFGVALCEETINGTMPYNHPLRILWKQHATSLGWAEPTRLLNRYYNGGFVGVNATSVAFLELWDESLRTAVVHGLDLGVFMTGSREQPFYASDQDALNVAAMYFKGELSTIGPEGMAFHDGGFTMHHAVGYKPWRKNFISFALRGIPPNGNDKRFLECAQSPIRLYSKRQLRMRKLALIVGSVIGRFYHRA